MVLAVIHRINWKEPFYGYRIRLGLLLLLPMTAFASDPVNGQKLYSMHCAGCHGVNGISVMQQAPNLAQFEVYTMPDRELVDLIRTGRNSMPPSLGILKQSEMLDVVSYMRTLH